jgi:hypothetical protein
MKERKMKKLAVCSLLLCCIMFFVASSAFAVKPGETVNPNGFPEGAHFNLNIHGKNIYTFTCPDSFDESTDCPGTTADCTTVTIDPPCSDRNGKYGKYVLDTTTCTWVWKYSGSIFIPESIPEGYEPIPDVEILMQSGKKGGNPKNVTLPTNQLIVTDACTEPFDEDEASFQLPPCEEGYRVYARVLGTPSNKHDDDREIKLISGSLEVVQDEYGNDLLYIGGVTGNTYTKPDGTTVVFKKERGRGQSVAVPITDLFLFTGDICYLTEPDGWTCEPDETTEDPFDCLNEYSLCCTPVLDEFDVPIPGEYESCALFEDVKEETFEGSGVYECPEGSDAVTAYCQYYEDVWISEIADLVEYLFGVDNDGVKLLQLRFYPNCKL